MTATEVASSLLAEKGLKLDSIAVLQALWAGYGHVCEVTASPLLNDGTDKSESGEASSLDSSAKGKTSFSYILKIISPPLAQKQHDEGHMRKILSYKVEQYFYTHLATQLPPSIPVAKCIASIYQTRPDGTSTTAMIMTDLRQSFPVSGESRAVLNEIQVHAALKWLASFHGFWWTRVRDDIPCDTLVRPPLVEESNSSAHTGLIRDGTSVWLNGGYTYLATRRSEYANLAADDESEWSELLTSTKKGKSASSVAETVAEYLAPSETGNDSANDEYMTLLHGDVKTENLFTTLDGTSVAFYDFQYIGLGLGVCDLAKLFTCSVPLEMLVGNKRVGANAQLPMQKPEEDLLRRYLKQVEETSGREYKWDIFLQHWENALVDWLRFQASWGFWGNTRWLEARVRSILASWDVSSR